MTKKSGKKRFRVNFMMVASFDRVEYEISHGILRDSTKSIPDSPGKVKPTAGSVTQL